jgi:hypothetical protein
VTLGARIRTDVGAVVAASVGVLVQPIDAPGALRKKEGLVYQPRELCEKRLAERDV